MSEETDSILAKELKKLGGFLSGWVARRLPDNTGEVHMVIHAPADRVLFQAQALLGASSDPPLSTPGIGGGWTVTGVLGSGFAEMNPVVVTAEIRPSQDPARTDVTVRGVAKEGLIKQRAGETGANRFALELAQACGPYSHPPRDPR